MPDTLSARPAGQWIKISTQVGIIFLLIWGGAIWYWRTADQAPETGDLLVTLLVLPLALVGVAQVGKALLLRKRSPATSATLPAPTQALDREVPTASMMTILATSLHLPHGTSTDELAIAIAQNKVRPDVDKSLLDSSGLPVMSQRSSDAVDEALQEEVGAWLAESGSPEPQFGEELWRALTLGSFAVRDLVLQANRSFLIAEGTPPLLRVFALLPADWTVEQRRFASQWFIRVAVQCGWPASRISTDEASTPSSASTVFSQLIQESSPFAALIIGSASNIGHETVNQWDANRALFTSTNPNGHVPGEGAAGLLLTNQDPTQWPVSQPRARFYLEEQVVDADSGARNKPGSSLLLRNLAERISTHLAAPLSEISMIVTDSGEQPTRVLEVMQFANTLMPQVDGSTDIVFAGTACGTCGAVPLLAAINLACHFSAERQSPVLCIGNDDPARRSIALVFSAEVIAA